MLALRSRVWTEAVVGERGEESSSGQRADQGHRHLRQWLRQVPLPHHSPSEHCSVGDFPLLNVSIHRPRVLPGDVPAPCHAVFHK